jgi:Fe-S-cluster-containing hydrogenase component 2
MERNQMVEKVVQVNQKLCTGCGSCIDACSVGVIHLVDHVVQIDDALCIACETCLETCPNGAIIAITTPVSTAPITVRPVTDPGLVLVQQPAALPETTVPVGGLKPLIEAAFAFLGSEVAPRLVDVVIQSIERRLAQPITMTISPSIPSSRKYSTQSRGQRKQIRHRGGGMGNRKYKGRR